jgi:lipopolysaccharide export system protein LptC
MNGHSTFWFPLVLLTLLAALTFWLERLVQPPQAAGALEGRRDPDYIVDGLSAVRLAPEGRIRHTLHAEKMVHYPHDDSTRLESPRFVSHAATDAPVTITSREALVSSEGENIYFHDDVLVRREAFGDNSELVVRTSYLHVIPDENIAKTDRPVTISDANTVVKAVGLELNSETRVLKLLSRVKGIYHDPDRPARSRGD